MSDVGIGGSGQEEPGEAFAVAERREVAEYALLGLLREGPRHGYRLAAAFAPEGRLGVTLRLKMSQMYAYLRKLERQGLLLAHDELDAGSHRARRVFALTPQGERVFDTWLAEPVEATREVRLAFLIKLAFTLDDSVAAMALIERQREATDRWLALQRSRAARMTEDTPLAIARLTMRHRILLSEATLTWLDETAAQFRSLTSQG
ncbi:MAG TPA: helix-turn-helix transcriptional regulator [Ktedonobacterales bacterium]|jgi:DNA-binding PadR family transcriptional regulator|nr:helix-turn-helix transcriptional regulator [Ktedonobacterales bacterium]